MTYSFIFNNKLSFKRKMLHYWKLNKRPIKRNIVNLNEQRENKMLILQRDDLLLIKNSNFPGLYKLNKLKSLFPRKYSRHSLLCSYIFFFLINLRNNIRILLEYCSFTCNTFIKDRMHYNIKN